MFIWAEISFQNNGDKLQLIQWWNDLSKKSVWGVSFPDMQRVLYCFVIFYSMINRKINKMQKVMWAQVWGPKCGRGHVMLLLLTIIQRIRSICLLVALSYPLETAAILLALPGGGGRIGPTTCDLLAALIPNSSNPISI